MAKSILREGDTVHVNGVPLKIGSSVYVEAPPSSLMVAGLRVLPGTPDVAGLDAANDVVQSLEILIGLRVGTHNAETYPPNKVREALAFRLCELISKKEV